MKVHLEIMDLDKDGRVSIADLEGYMLRILTLRHKPTYSSTPMSLASSPYTYLVRNPRPVSPDVPNLKPHRILYQRTLSDIQQQHQEMLPDEEERETGKCRTLTLTLTLIGG